MKYRLKVKEIAQAKGFSMGKLSRRADLDKAAIKRMYDDPHYNPTLLTMLRVAKALRVKIDELVEVLPDEDDDGDQ